GSVVPRFKEQIRNGGPVTVTTPGMRRFFMTIPEAVELVLQAGSIGHSGEIMVLEMGEAVVIADMARKLIELSGLIPDEDIKIEFTGLRPGEKEYEEIITEDENVVRTPYDKIFVMRKTSEQNDNIDIKLLEELVISNDEPALRKLLVDYIPENMFQKNT
ncbi:MAG: polysaccharide biosynthesis protein, partial [Lentisphaerota bacterium]